MLKSLLTAAALVIALTAPGHAEYPEKPIRYLLHVSPGGATDIMARKMASGLEKVLGVSVVVENRAGGRGAAQLAELAAAAPDGYTIGAVTNTHLGSFNQTLKQYGVDSFDWVARLVTEPYLLAVRGESQIKSMRDLAKAATDAPGSVIMAGFVRGSGGHFAWEMIAQAMGLDSAAVRWVPYDSAGDAVTAVLGGHGEITIHHVDMVKDHVAAGSLRVIGVMADERLPQFPDVPTLREQGVEVDTSWQQFRGVIGPKGIPADVKAKLGAAMEEVLNSAEMKEYFEETSLVSAYLPPEGFTDFAKDQDALTKAWMAKLGLQQ